MRSERGGVVRQMRWWYNLLSKWAVEPLPKPKPMDSYKGVSFKGSTFPDDPYRTVKVTLNSTILNEYIPALNAIPDIPKGLKCLMIAMTHAEGFRKGTRSYRTNNPGNIGNVDSGANKALKSLTDGILLQAQFLRDIAGGKKKAWPLGKFVVLKPDFSKEIANNLKAYGAKSGDIPGYSFTYTGQLDQFIKIYATLPRISNSYLNTIVSYFAKEGLTITPETKLSEIFEMG